MSVTIPVVAELGISWYTILLAVSIPIINEPFKSGNNVVLNPEITTLSPLLSDGAVDIEADISPLSFLKNTTFS